MSCFVCASLLLHGTFLRPRVKEHVKGFYPCIFLYGELRSKTFLCPSEKILFSILSFFSPPFRETEGSFCTTFILQAFTQFRSLRAKNVLFHEITPILHCHSISSVPTQKVKYTIKSFSFGYRHSET